MPQFTRRNTQPMRPDSYRRIARLLRGIADRIDAAADADNPVQRRQLTMTLHTLATQGRQWWLRHRATVDGSLNIPTRG